MRFVYVAVVSPVSMQAKPKSALLIVGHGSTENPDSSIPYFNQVDYVRESGLFGEVHTCFWKEEPSMREAYYMIDADEIYVVPSFISEGYFTQEVIPRELELTARTSTVRGKTVHYCDPVGIHDTMTDLLIERAKEVSENAPVEDTTLIVVGHGTGLNDNSTKSIKDQARLIAERIPGYQVVTDGYMEQEPLIEHWDQIGKDSNHVVVVPFFIADGAHSYQDIPVMLGIEKDEGLAASQREVFRNNPYEMRGKTLYYSSAIGTSELMGKVILDQVAHFDAHYAPNTPESTAIVS